MTTIQVDFWDVCALYWERYGSLPFELDTPENTAIGSTSIVTDPRTPVEEKAENQASSSVETAKTSPDTNKVVPIEKKQVQ